MMQEKLKKKEINFELLRIFSMILIILHHYAIHGGLLGQSNLNGQVALVIAFGGKIGVNLFVLISGYFLVEAKCNIPKVLKLILKVYCYSIFIMIVSLCTKNKFTKQEIIYCSITPLTNLYWFVKNYIFMYICSPVLNYVIKKLTQIEYLIILIVAFVILCVLVPFSMNTYIWFLYIYLIGAYIKIYDIKFKTRLDKILIIIGLYISIIYINFVVLKQYEIIWEYLFECNFIPIFIISILIFVLFKNLKIKKNEKIINYIASLSFPVYLIHDNDIFRDFLWKNIFQIEYFYHANLLLLFWHILSSIVGIYLVSAILEWSRNNFIKKLMIKNKSNQKLI